MSSRKAGLLIGAGLLLATLAAYAPLWQNDFVNIDDGVYIWQNPHVQRGFTPESLRWAFDLSFDEDWRPYEANWHPLTWLSHMLDSAIFGAERTGTSPRGHHAVNLLLHAVSAVCLFWALVRLTDAVALGTNDAAAVEADHATTARSNLLASAFVAALFALHPLHVEAVAWAAERKEVLCGLFWWLSLVAYAAWVRRPSLARYALLVVLFALGLTSKAMIVTLPAVLLLLDFWPLRRWTRLHDGREILSARAVFRSVVEKWPLYLLSLGSAYVTYHAQQHGGTTRALEPMSLAVRLANAALASVAYLRQTFWPTGLAVFYPHPHREIAADGFGATGVWWATGLLAAITILAIVVWRRWPWLFTGWFWYLVTLVPVLGIVQVGRQARADRYTYIPLVGIFIAVAWGLATLAEWLDRGATAQQETASTKRPRRVFSQAVVASGIGVLLACAAITWRQAEVWRNDLTLFGHALAVTSHNELAELNYGTALLEAGRPAEAVPHLSRAVEYQPESAEGWRNLGASLALSGNVAGGTAQLRRALDVEPNFMLAARDLARILATTNDDFTRDGREALRWAEHAAVLTNYQDPESLSVLAMALAETGDFEGAKRALSRAFELAQQAGQTALLEQYKAQFARYQAGRPVRMKWGPQ